MRAPHDGLRADKESNSYAPQDPSSWTAFSSNEYATTDGEWLVTLQPHPVYVRTSDGAIFVPESATDGKTLVPYDVDEKQVEDPSQQRVTKLGDPVREESSERSSPSDDGTILDIISDVKVGFLTSPQSEKLVGRPKDIIPTDAFEEEQASLTWTAIYESSTSGRCGEFVSEKLTPAFLSSLRSTYVRLASKRKREDDTNTKRARLESDDQNNTEVDICLETIVANLPKGVRQANHNFCQTAKRENCDDVAQTTGILLFGPDGNGALRTLTYNLGSCKAFLCSSDGIRELTGKSDGFLGRPDAEKVLSSKLDHVDFERDNWILIGSNAVWRALTPSKLNSLVRQGLRSEFENFMEEASLRFNGEPEGANEWFTEESKKWLRNLSLDQAIATVMTKAMPEGGAAWGLTVMIFAWRPLEALIGGG